MTHRDDPGKEKGRHRAKGLSLDDWMAIAVILIVAGTALILYFSGAF